MLVWILNIIVDSFNDRYKNKKKIIYFVERGKRTPQKFVPLATQVLGMSTNRLEPINLLNGL